MLYTVQVGLCVDYSAHIAHTFLTEPGRADVRMAATLAKMGPAVFNGGFRQKPVQVPSNGIGIFFHTNFEVGIVDHDVADLTVRFASSTLLAILLLVNSQSYVFISFFKVFFLMITLGLLHGLVVLPVLLRYNTLFLLSDLADFLTVPSLLEPGPYSHHETRKGEKAVLAATTSLLTPAPPHTK